MSEQKLKEARNMLGYNWKEFFQEMISPKALGEECACSSTGTTWVGGCGAVVAE